MVGFLSSLSFFGVGARTDNCENRSGKKRAQLEKLISRPRRPDPPVFRAMNEKGRRRTAPLARNPPEGRDRGVHRPARGGAVLGRP